MSIHTHKPNRCSHLSCYVCLVNIILCCLKCLQTWPNITADSLSVWSNLINNAESKNYIQIAPSGFIMKKPLNKAVGEFHFGTRRWEGLTQIAGSNLHHQFTVMTPLKGNHSVVAHLCQQKTPELHFPRTLRTCKTNQIKLEKTVYRRRCHGNITCLRSAPLADKPGVCVTLPVDGNDKDQKSGTNMLLISIGSNLSPLLQWWQLPRPWNPPFLLVFSSREGPQCWGSSTLAR